MNQILMTKDKDNNSSVKFKPIVKFFAIAIIIFAIIFIGEGSYNLYTAKNKEKIFEKPILNVEKNGSTMNLEVNGGVGINKIEYSWNNGIVTTLNAEGKKYYKAEIEIPQGDNILNISTIDIEGNKTVFENVNVVFTLAEDTTKPKVSIVNSAGKLTVTATDETEIESLTYQWEGEEEVKVETRSEDNKTITQDINVQKGTKVLKIVAKDKTGNKEELSKKVVGSNGPEIKVTAEGDYLVVKVTDEYTITKVVYTFNEEDFTVNDIPQNAKEYEFKLKLKDGTNYLKVTAYENELRKEYKCKKTK